MSHRLCWRGQLPPAVAGRGPWCVASDGVNPFIATGNTFGQRMGRRGIHYSVHSRAVFSGQTEDYWTPTNWVALDTAIWIGRIRALIVDVPGATPSKLILALGRMATRTS